MPRARKLARIAVMPAEPPPQATTARATKTVRCLARRSQASAKDKLTVLARSLPRPLRAERWACVPDCGAIRAATRDRRVPESLHTTTAHVIEPPGTHDSLVRPPRPNG